MDAPTAKELACSECGFKATDGNAYVDHVLLTGHTVDAETLSELKTNAHSLAEFVRQLDSVLDYARLGTMPPGSRPIREDELTESELKWWKTSQLREMPNEALADGLDMIGRLAPGEVRLFILEAASRLKSNAKITAFVEAVNARAKADIAEGKPLEGAHHRAMMAIQKEWNEAASNQEKTDV